MSTTNPAGAVVGETAEDPVVGLLRRNPVLLAALVLLLPSIGAAVAAWAEGHTAVAIIAAGFSVLIATMAPILRAAVTPNVLPRDTDGRRLYPLLPVGATPEQFALPTTPTAAGVPGSPRAPGGGTSLPADGVERPATIRASGNLAD